MMDSTPRMGYVYVVSDSVGDTAESVARAAMSQFQANSDPRIIRRIPFVNSRDRVEEAVRQVLREGGGLIVYTLVVPEIRRHMDEVCARAGIDTVDLMGPVMDSMENLLGRKPRQEPGIIHRMDEQYFRRVAAVEFAVKYDDGKDPRGFLLADVVLVGVSRTSKTPVCMYLAHREKRAANYPLTPEITPPRELYLARDRIIGLTISAEQLQEIRRERIRRLGLKANSAYDDPRRIREELSFAREIFSELECPVIDVTHKAVEETATTVLEMMRKGEWSRG
ncbi:MAG: pyruvate, water dikinase regulatory protein [Bacillota bacterium]